MRSFLTLFIVLLFAVPSSLSYGYSFDKQLYSDYIKGIYFMQKGVPSLALEYLEKAKKKHPDLIYIRHKIATALIQQERIAEAKIVLEEAKKIDAYNLDTYLALIFIYSFTGESNRLESEYGDFLKKAYKKKPDDITISSYLAQFYFYQGRLDEALVLYEEILKINPEKIDAFFWLGYLYYESDQHRKAKETWKKGLELDPNNPPLLNALGYTYAEKGVKLDKAKAMIETALAKDPHNGAYIDSLGWVYYKKGDLNKAKMYIKEALKYTKDPEIYLHLGIIYVDLGKKEKGLEVYREGLEKFPDDQNLRKKLKKYE